MKATGIVRRIDDLGRIVIPKEIRRNLHIREGDQLGFICYKNSNNEESVHDMVKLSARFLANICES